MQSIALQSDYLKRVFELLSADEIGGSPDGGYSRPALGANDIAARKRLSGLFAELNLEERVDDAGSMYGRLEGADPSLPPVVIGSHLDTVDGGGKYDGILGVAVALATVESIRKAGITPNRSIDVVNWTGEEGSRFSPAMLGSGVSLSLLDKDKVYSGTDADGTTFEAALRESGYCGDEANRPGEIHAALELHIEQDVRLDQAGVGVGVVAGISPVRWIEYRVAGNSGHAGGPGNSDRTGDVVAAVSRMALAARQHARAVGECKTNIGRLVLDTAAPNVVPGGARFVLDIRADDDATLERNLSAIENEFDDICSEEGVSLASDEFHRVFPTEFDSEIRAELVGSAQARGHGYLELNGGIGHDALNLARVTRTAMVFTPTPGGISHTPDEHSPWEAVVASAEIYLDVTVSLACK